jgi:transglutaminase-like putative cysteine protease
MMFRPRESHDLNLLATRLEITPQPARLRWLHDVFDNSVAIATFAGKTAELRFDSTVTLEHLETTLPDYVLDDAAQIYPFRYPDDEGPDLISALLRRYPAPDVERWARQFLTGVGTQETMGLLHAMTLGISNGLVYERRTQKGVQTPSQTLKRGRGSCRVFALLMMEAVRSLGLAARFVSGYIASLDSGTESSVGGGATHAWLQVYLPGAGWVDFDPTNSIIGNRNLIRVAMAWDPRQALPLWGTFDGPASAPKGMEVEVSVTDVSGKSPPSVHPTDPVVGPGDGARSVAEAV